MLLIVLTLATQAQRKDIVLLELKRQIDATARRATVKTFEIANEIKASAIVIDMNTPGGLLNEADSIRTLIMHSKIPVYVLINPNAASAGALISIACNKIYMTDGSTIGAATVVNQNAEELPDKYQSYMRAMMRSTAEFRGRNPSIAEGMVDEKLDIPGIKPVGQVITLTRTEAIKYGYCDGKAERIEEVLAQEGISDFNITKLRFTAIDKIINFLINPVIQGFLILLIIAGIYYELQAPGIGFALATAVTAAVLYFAPLYIEKLAASWEILLFIVGAGLMLLEIFVVPGFGITGIAGIAFMLTGLVLSMINNIYFDFRFTGGQEIIKSLLVVMTSFIISFIFIISTGRQFIRSKPFQKLVLQDTLQTPDFRDEFVKSQKESLINSTGITLTPMHPTGKIQIGNNIYDAITEGEFLENNTQIIIVQDFGNKIIVRKSEIIS